MNCYSKTETHIPYAVKSAKLRPNMAQVLTSIFKIVMNNQEMKGSVCTETSL